MATYKSPGVYVKEIPLFPPSVAEVETAIPAFIGYTEKITNMGQSLTGKPMRIKSLLEYEEIFGKSFRDPSAKFIDINFDNTNILESVEHHPKYHLYDSIRLFYANGGGPCFIVSAGQYSKAGTINKGDLEAGITALKKEDEPTIIVVPDSVLTGSDSDTASIQTTALTQCGNLGDRFAILDIMQGDKEPGYPFFPINHFRNKGTTSYLKYGAAYYPWLKTTLSIDFGFRNLNFQKRNQAGDALSPTDLSSIIVGDTSLIDQLINTIDDVDSIKTKYNQGNFQNSYDGIVVTDDENQFNFDKLKQKGQKIIEIIDTFSRWHTSAPLFKDKDEFDMIDDLTIYDIFQRETSETSRLITLLSRLNTFTASTYSDYDGDGNSDSFVLDFTPLINDLENAIDSTLTKFDPTDQALTGKIIQTVNFKLNLIFNELMNHIHLFMDMAEERSKNLEILLEQQVPIYAVIIKKVKEQGLVLPPGGAIAGIYARVDNDRGVWKAPANISLNEVSGPTVKIDNAEQDSLNIDVNSGKSVNAIRSFTGRGTLVWGARTLAGNDNEWRYISVRRFFNMVEESVKKSTAWAVFEPNDANTWIRVKSMIENYLTQLWRQGALFGSTSEEAFFVKIGLGITMTAQDIFEGRMNVEIGMAAVRPAEFIILKFSHKMPES